MLDATITDQWRALFATTEPTRHPTAPQKRLAARVREEYARTGQPVQVTFANALRGATLRCNWRTIAKLVAIGDLFPVEACENVGTPFRDDEIWIAVVPSEVRP